MDIAEQLAALNRLPSDRQHRIALGLCVLCEALTDAAGFKASPVEFAVPQHELLEAGLTGRDIRWLIASGITHDVRDRRQASRTRRLVDSSGGTRSIEPSCFMLSDSVAPVALTWSESILAVSNVPVKFIPSPVKKPTKPRWDVECRELWWGELSVKRFKVPAPSQVLILTAFEELRWSRRIDDPLPRGEDSDQSQRLHDAIKGLNRGQYPKLIRFFGDGQGRGVCWSTAKEFPRDSH